MPGPSISSTFTAPDCAARRKFGASPRCSKLMKTQAVSRTQPAPISMSGATLPGAGTRRRSRTPLRIRPRTSAIGWPRKIQPPMPKAMPSLTTSSAVSRETILLMSSPVQHVAGDHQALDLVGALEDLVDLGVAHEALDLEVAHVAGAAEDLYRVGRHLHRRVAGEALEHRRLGREAVPLFAVGHAGAVVEHAACRLGLHLHVGQHELDALELGNRLAELLAFAAIGDRGVDGALRQADRDRADRRPVEVEDAHAGLEGLALGTDHVLGRDAHIVEEDRHVGHAANAHLAVLLAEGESLALGVEDEGRDAVGALAFAGAGEHQDEMRYRAEGDVDLAAVQHPAVAVLHRARLHRRHVRPGARLGDSDGGEGAALGGQAEIVALLLFGAEIQD